MKNRLKRVAAACVVGLLAFGAIRAGHAAAATWSWARACDQQMLATGSEVCTTPAP